MVLWILVCPNVFLEATFAAFFTSLVGLGQSTKVARLRKVQVACIVRCVGGNRKQYVPTMCLQRIHVLRVITMLP